jgi:hypothetical protein
MIIKHEKVLSKIDRMNRKWHTWKLTIQCDQCFIEFFRLGPNVNRSIERKHHFCSQACSFEASKPGGVLRIAIEQKCLEKYGVTSPLGSKECQAKSRETCQQKYGVDHVAASVEHLAARKATNLQRYGNISPLATSQCREALMKEDVQARRLESINKVNWSARAAKSHATMKRNGTYRTSRTENQMYEALCQKFGIDDITRGVTIQSWPIDFYIKSIDLYIQFDGIYWHGLDRPIEEIKQFKRPRDKIIYGKWLCDQRQNEWFKENNKKLIRITDVEFRQNPCILDNLIT